MRALNISLILLVLLGLPTLGAAADPEVAHLTQLLERASSNLAFGASGLSGYNSVEHHAERLNNSIGKMLDSIARGRADGNVRTRFTDVTRYYQRLEEAYLRAGAGHNSRLLNQRYNELATVYDRLRLHFYGDSYYRDLRVTPLVVVPYNQVDRYYPRNQLPDNYNRRDRGRYDSPQHRAPVTTRNNRQQPDWDHYSAVEQRQRRNDRVDGRVDGHDNGRRSRRGGDDRQVANQGYTRLGRGD